MDAINGIEKKLRIGMMIRDLEELENWQLRILEGVMEHPQLELSLFIKDGRNDKPSFASRFKRNILTTKAAANVLYRFQVRLENFLAKPALTVDKKDIIEKTKNIETILLHPARKGFHDVFSAEESAQVKSYNLDIIIRHEFNIIQGNILEAAQYGIWSYHHADNAINRGGPVGFWEFANNEPCCGVTLQRLTPELDGGLVIAKAWYNKSSWSFVKNRNELLEKSVALLFISIDKLLLKGRLETKKSLTYYHRLYTAPALRPLLKYMGRFYGHGMGHLFRRLFPSQRRNRWALFYGKGEFMETALFRLQQIPMPGGVFWADPFLYRHEKQLYVFFENYSDKTAKGKISFGRVVEEKGRYALADVGDALDFDYHLSYPQIIEEDGEIFLLPESEQNRRLEIYRAVEFPAKWELYATAFAGEGLVDTTYFRDENGDRWLFVNKGWPYDSYLYIYQIDSLKLEKIVAHKENPVICDCRRARNGGAIFKYGKEYHRPSQSSTAGLYGNALQISKITKLTLEDYAEEQVITIEPKFKTGLIGIHHLHQIAGEFAFDARYRKM